METSGKVFKLKISETLDDAACAHVGPTASDTTLLLVAPPSTAGAPEASLIDALATALASGSDVFVESDAALITDLTIEA